MIEVKATEFHNNIGHYLDLLANGKQVKILRSKPKKPDLIIQSYENARKVQELRKSKIMKLIKENKNTSTKWKSGLEFQKWVRE